MRSVPGAQMNKPPPAGGTRVLCPDCGSCMVTLPEGWRLSTRGATAARREAGKCPVCAAPYDLPLIQDGAR